MIRDGKFDELFNTYVHVLPNSPTTIIKLPIQLIEINLCKKQMQGKQKH